MPKPKLFDPEGGDYDYTTARSFRMKPDPKNKHWGSVTQVPSEYTRKLGLPDESYLLLKGRKHKTWNLAVQGEEERGFKVIKWLDKRYYSVPQDWMP